MSGLTRQEAEVVAEGPVVEGSPAWGPEELAAPLGNSSLETFSNFLNSLKKGFDQGSEIALLVVEFLYKSNNPTAIKILNLYRTDCRFRKALRNATLDAVNNAGLIYSLRRDQKCINNADRAFIAAALASLAVNIATVIRQYIKA